MYRFGRHSLENLSTAHEDLQQSCNLAMSWQIFDFGISWGYRGEQRQNEAFLSGASRRRYPFSQHNATDDHGAPCSNAIDFYPWCQLPDGSMGIPWKDTHAFAVIGGLILAAGAVLGTPLRWGGDWDMDGTTTDQLLKDWGHIERARNLL